MDDEKKKRLRRAWAEATAGNRRRSREFFFLQEFKVSIVFCLIPLYPVGEKCESAVPVNFVKMIHGKADSITEINGQVGLSQRRAEYNRRQRIVPGVVGIEHRADHKPVYLPGDEFPDGALFLLAGKGYRSCNRVC